MVDRIRLYTSPFITRNQEIKTLQKLNQVIKQASRDESSDQASISTIKILDRRHSWKYRAHSPCKASIRDTGVSREGLRGLEHPPSPT